MKIPHVDYDQTPFLIIWETTQACDLVCRHCRLAAQPERDPCELSTEEGESVLRQAKELGTPIFILSGGDPLKRQDLHHLIRYGADLGLRMATIPAATPTLTEAAVSELKKAGLSQVALSLDFPTAELHDGFRGVPGAWAKTMEAIGWAKKNDLPLQINTTICRDALPHLDRMINLVRSLPIVFWEVFFLVPMGRGSELGGLTAAECEAVFAKLYRLQKEVSFLVKVTEAPHYRRFVAEQERLEGETTHRHPGALPSQLVRTEGPGHTIGLAPRGVNAGKGFLFISHLGEVFPSGFLPISAGNIRHTPLATLYRESELFLKLRDPDQLMGICGRCEYRAICGGSRSRAYALSGNLLASDPWCAYRPAELQSI